MEIIINRSFILILFLLCAPLIYADNCYNSSDCITGYQSTHQICEGKYCGRILLNGLVLDDICGGCDWGFKSDGWVCAACEDPIETYGILYLLFFGLLVFYLHLFSIYLTSKTKRYAFTFGISSFVEVIAAYIVSLLILKPYGTLEIQTCPPTELSDWYTEFSNVDNFYCSQEAVYPLYSIVLIFFGFSAFFLLLIRPFISQKYCKNEGSKAIYAALLFLPILTILQASIGGLLYYSFPYMVLITSVVTEIYALAKHDSIFYSSSLGRLLFLLRYFAMAFSILSIIAFYRSLYYSHYLLAFLLPFSPVTLYWVFHKYTSQSEKWFSMCS